MLRGSYRRVRDDGEASESRSTNRMAPTNQRDRAGRRHSPLFRGARRRRRRGAHLTGSEPVHRVFHLQRGPGCHVNVLGHGPIPGQKQRDRVTTRGRAHCARRAGEVSVNEHLRLLGCPCLSAGLRSGVRPRMDTCRHTSRTDPGRGCSRDRRRPRRDHERRDACAPAPRSARPPRACAR